MDILVWAGIAIVVASYSVCIITTSVFCRSSRRPVNPAEYLLLQTRSDCHRDLLNLNAAQGVFSTVSDIYVLVLPIHLIWHLRLSQGRRVGICTIFLVGLMFVTAFTFQIISKLTTIARATACSIATLYTRFAQRNSTDFIGDSTRNFMLGYIH